MKLLEEQMKEMKRQEKAQASAQKELAAFADDFLKSHISDNERAMIRRLVKNAVEKGHLEAMVYSFPSDLCIDGGRAINNSDPDWPATLQGKAKEMYDAFKARIHTQGYKLKAMIINFPGGVPGDVGFFLIGRRRSRRGRTQRSGWPLPFRTAFASGSPGPLQWTSGTTLRGVASVS